MFGFLKTLFRRPQPALEKQGQPPAVDRHSAPSAATSESPQQAILDNELAYKLEPAPDERLTALVGSKIKVEDRKDPEKSGTAQNLETPKWMSKETPAPEPDVAADASSNIEVSDKASEVSVAETTAVTSPTSKPKSLRTATRKTAAVKKKLKIGSKKAEGISRTGKKAVTLKKGPAKPKT